MKLLDILLENYEEEEVFPKGKVAYHVTPDIYIENIKKEGLTPKSESKVDNHPERIYLYLNPESSYKTLVSDLWNSSKYKDKIKNYYVLEIDLTKIPEHKFYGDSQSYFGYLGIYTTQPIPPISIKVTETISVKDLPSSAILKDTSDEDDELRKTIQKFGGDNPNEIDPWDEILKRLGGEDVTLNENINRIKVMMKK
jgi:hypothetical protein